MGHLSTTQHSQREIAAYAADMLASLKRMSSENGMDLLAHLVDLARAEAVRNRQGRQVS